MPCLSYPSPATTSMTFLPLARTILAAAAPLLSPKDSTTVARPTQAPAPVSAPAPKVDEPLLLALASGNLGDVFAPSTFAPIVAAPAAAPVAAMAAKSAVVIAGPDGRVPMPAWTAGARTGMARAARADSIVVEKGVRRMTLFAGGEAVGTYLVAIGKTAFGAKERAGDFRTPEGLYHIDARNPNSRFHLALHVSYPNAQDVARAKQLGVSTGGDIMIHGLPNGQGSVGSQHRSYDWTNGCVAVTDQEIEEIWNAVPVGTPIRIVP
jgi:L,D-peptidoglycan transpeptidase YkuD (ErfK/YbiS/YcfS/YnhG family)